MLTLSPCVPNAAVIDYYMEDGNALDLIPRLKNLDSTVPVFVLTGHGTIDLAVGAIKEGAEQFVTKPVDFRVLVGQLAKAIDQQRIRRRQAAGSARSARFQRDPFLGSSSVIQRLGEEAHQVVESDLPILIQGETGTGKGVLAEWLHQNSPRRDEAFVDINCAGLSRELLESELFGHERGAFTGAVTAKTGLLEVAHNGTAFLDELGDMDLLVQAKLLKVLDEKKLRRLGEIRDRKIRIRLIAATHQDLLRLVSEKRFRSDLFFRISTIPLRVPSLRERAEDIPALARFLVRNLSLDLGNRNLELSEDACQALQRYQWPGNIRELRNVLERAALVAGGDIIGPRDLAFQVHTLPSTEFMGNGEGMTLEEMEASHIAKTLQRTGGAVEKAAVQLGIAKSTLYSKIKYYKIEVPAGR